MSDVSEGTHMWNTPRVLTALTKSLALTSTEPWASLTLLTHARLH